MDATISVVRSLGELRPLRDDWDRLARAQANPFMCFSWHDHWFTHFGSTFEVWALVVRKAHTVIAICPWSIRTRALPLLERKLTWLGYHGVTPTSLDILVAPDEWMSAKPLLLNRLTSSREFDRWDFRRVAHGSYAAELLLTAPHVSDVQDLSCPITVLPASPDEYFRAVSKGLRKELRRKHARLAMQGEVSYEACIATPDVMRVFPEFVQLNQQRMVRKQINGGFVDPVFARFHESLIVDLADQGLVRLQMLRLNGRAVAATYCLASGDYQFGYQSGFDVAYQALSPMTVLDGIRLRHLIEQGRVRSYDWGPGLSPYKCRFSNKERRYHHIRGAQPSLPGRLWKGLFRTKRWLKRLPGRIWRTFQCQLEDVVMFGALDTLTPRVPGGSETVRLILPSDLEGTRTLLGESRYQQFLDRVQGSWGIGAWDQNRLVGYAWATNLPRTDEGERPLTYTVSPPEDTVWLYDFYVFPPARNRGIGARIMSAHITHASFRGHKYVCLTHSAENKAAIGLSKRLGLRELGRIRLSRSWWRTSRDTSVLDRIREHRFGDLQLTQTPKTATLDE